MSEAADHSELQALPVRTPRDVESLRQIRNACRSFMTRDTSWISPSRQRRWWAERDPRRTEMFLFRRARAHGGTLVGYGLIRREPDRRAWLSGGLLPRFRGNGLGRQLFADLATRGQPDCYLEVQVGNLPARRTYEALGFAVVGRRPGVVVMRLLSY